jgi:hypothetical protein
MAPCIDPTAELDAEHFHYQMFMQMRWSVHLHWHKASSSTATPLGFLAALSTSGTMQAT